MYRMSAATVAILIAAGCAAACTRSIASPSADPTPAGSAPVPITITESIWKLRSFQPSGSPTVAVPSPDSFTLELRADGKQSVRADCNRCSGTYVVAGETLVLGSNAACTRAACSSAPFDQQYVQALSGATITRAAGDALKAVSPAGVLTFTR
jgi:heat shock protein HslJ